MRLFCVAILIGVFCVGCSTVTSGTKFNVENVDRLEPGETTTAEAREWLGEPYQVVTNEKGEQLYVWQHVEARAFVGTVNTDMQRLSVVFSESGRMIRIHQKINIPNK